MNRELVKAAYYAVTYDGYHLNPAALSPSERAVWDEIAASDDARREMDSPFDFEDL